jgi:hypothetical protein
VDKRKRKVDEERSTEAGVPDAAESWRRNTEIHDLVNRIRDTRRERKSDSRRTPAR